MSERLPPVVVVLIDAFRHDFVSEAVTPNLARIAADRVQLPLQPILGYSDAIRATFFTGRYPDETGYWMEYCYRPDTSPWKGIERYRLIDEIPVNVAARGIKMAASMTAMRSAAKKRGIPHLDLRNMPLKAVHKFDFTLNRPMTHPKALGFPSIFDVCATSGRPWAYLDASKIRGANNFLNLTDGLSGDVGLIFVYLHQIDMAAHVFGISSKRFWDRVRFTDDLLGQLMLRLTARFGDLDPVIFSDHGMTVLLRQIGIDDLLDHPGFPERFFVALDATMVRLWFFDDDERLRSEVRERVATRYPGRFLSEGDLAKYHLQFSNRLYGDEFYLLNPGIGIFPNYHSYIKPKAMHAYEPAQRDQWGIFIGPSTCRSSVSIPVNLTEVTAVVMNMLNSLAPGS